MSELRVHVSTSQAKTSVRIDSGGLDYDADSESDCGCGENQLAHYEIDGAVHTDLPKRCLRHVNGPIGGTDSERAHSDHSTNDKSDTEPETIEHNSMSVRVPSEQSIAPPANQLQEVQVKQMKNRPPLSKRVARWNKVEAARKSSNKQKKNTRRSSGSVDRGDFQVTLRVLGKSRKLNIVVATRG